jgi:hypothetical protein
MNNTKCTNLLYINLYRLKYFNKVVQTGFKNKYNSGLSITHSYSY